MHWQTVNIDKRGNTVDNAAQPQRGGSVNEKYKYRSAPFGAACLVKREKICREMGKCAVWVNFRVRKFAASFTVVR
jgi:hypothetical protein